MRSRFDEQLSALKTEMIEMGALCEEAIALAAHALTTGELSKAEEVEPISADIDQKERDIEARCLKLLLQQQPVAGDLRQISAALKMITDMERIGDQAEDIAEIITYLDGRTAEEKIHIRDMAAETIVMVTVLRISVDRASGFSIAMGMLYPIIIVMVIAVIVSAVLAHTMSKKIIEPLNRLDLDNPMENDVYAEIAPLLGRIHRQNMKIERKAAELKRKKDEFDLITGNMHEGLMLLDKNKNILTINSAAASIFAADKNCVGNKFISVCRRHDISAAVEKAFSDGRSEIRATLSEREFQFDISRIDTNGEMVGAVILAVDITEQADAERTRREFTANVSHELKTPLHSIMGSAELIENGLVKSEDMPRFIGHIRDEAKRLVALVEDIIRLSQLDEQAEMPREMVSLYALACEAREALESSAEKKNITLTVKGEKGELICVKRLLFEVIYNLCDNAIRYTQNGGAVCVEISENVRETSLIVTDNGIGIAPEHQSRIFERFYRVDKSHSKKSGGTGLGLSIVKHAVLYHGGRISLNSAVGQGTAVTVTLPKGELK